MQTTFHVKAGEVNHQLLESIRKNFKEDEALTITIRSDRQADQYQMFLQSEELQKEYPPLEVDPHIDLSALANEVNL